MQELNRLSNPFPGLRPFEATETHLFFGRDGQSEEVLRRLRRTRFLAVVGTSGSGKSSLVRAGLLPALQGGLMASAGSDWRIAILRPGNDPVGNLARALASPAVLGSSDEKGAGMQEALTETTLRRSSLGLSELVGRARAKLGEDGRPLFHDYENLLIIVDQFEEIFRFKQLIEQEKSNEDAAAFVKLLLEAVREPGGKIYVVLTMRSDFLGDCAQFQELPEAINDGQYLIPRMTRDERREAITGPVAVGEGAISEPLVNQLLNDVGDSPDQLPIMQHALMRTWDHWLGHRRNGDLMDIPDYFATGGMSTALSRHADEAYVELSDPQKVIAEKLFKGLTEKEIDNREVRRPMEVEEICELTGADEAEVIAVIEVFRREGRSFLMPPPKDALTGAPIPLNRESLIDISHESLIRNWERLKAWTEEEAQSARIYRRLAESAVLHKAGEEALLKDPALQVSLDWREKNRPNAVWARRYHPDFETAMAFLNASVTARDAERLEQEQRRLKEASYKRTRLVAFLLAFSFLLALVAFIAAIVLERRAASALRSAEAARQKLQIIRNAQSNIQSYEMEQAERQLNELYGLTNDDDEGHEIRAWVFYNLGDLNSRLQQHNRASAFFLSALQNEMMIHRQLGLDSVGTLNSLARSLEDQGRYHAAVMRYEQLASLVDSVSNVKGRYYRLNAANVHVDLAELYVKQAAAAAGTGGALNASQVDYGTSADVEAAHDKAAPHYRAAIEIWDDVLRDDPNALADNYIKASAFYADKLGDKKTADDLLVKASQLRRKTGAPTARQPVGPPNPGNDPDIVTQFSPNGQGYVLFNPDAAYGRPEMLDFLQRVTSAWAARHPEHKIVIGDMSLRGGGPFLSHVGDHYDGREVDIWPVTNNGDAEPTNIYATNYSRELTVELINLIRQTAPTAVVYFDDPPLVASGLVRATLDHNNYMHVILP